MGWGIFAPRMNIILFDNEKRQSLFPLTFTCAIADLRTGILTIKERWETLSSRNFFIHTEEYLQPLYKPVPAGKNLWVDASVMADKALVNEILALDEGIAFDDELGFIAGVLETDPAEFDPGKALASFNIKHHLKNVRRLKYPWEIFQWNDQYIKEDFELLTYHQKSQPHPSSNHYINETDIFIEEGAEINFSSLNASGGPIYIGKNALVMEGSLIRGPFALCEGSVIKMGAKVYGATTVGPYCTAAGEIKNSVMQAYSNKGHDGYLGDAVIGKWCNLGAGTSNSNVKNNGTDVEMWSYDANDYIPVGSKGGLIMGDYSRTAINTSLNTGTVMGVCCNIFDAGLLPKYISNFTWGGKDFNPYEFEKALRDIANWKKMKHQTLNDEEKAILKHIFESF